MTYLIVRRIIVLPGRQVYDPGIIIDLPLSAESERRLIERGCIKRIERKKVTPLAEVMEDGTDHRRHKRQKSALHPE